MSSPPSFDERVHSALLDCLPEGTETIQPSLESSRRFRSFHSKVPGSAKVLERLPAVHGFQPVHGQGHSSAEPGKLALQGVQQGTCALGCPLLFGDTQNKRTSVLFCCVKKLFIHLSGTRVYGPSGMGPFSWKLMGQNLFGRSSININKHCH